MSSHIVLVFIAIIFLALLNKRWGLFLAFSLLVWMFSFRTNEVPDTATYQWMYDDPLSRLDVNEIGFLYLGILFKTLTGAEYQTFYTCLVVLCLILWYFATRRILANDTDLSRLLLIFVSFYGFFYLGIATRNFLSEILVLNGLGFFISLKGRKRILIYLIFVALAVLIHRSAAFFLLLLPLIKIKISNKGYYRLFFVCLFLWLVSGSSVSRGIVSMLSNVSMFAKLDNYSSSAESAPSILSLQILINWIISFFLIRSRTYLDRKYYVIYNYFLKVNMIGLVTLALIWSVPTSYRFYNMFFCFNFILLYLSIFHNRKIRTVKDKSIVSILISIVYFGILLHSFPEILFY